jgi:hypothetical protein
MASCWPVIFPGKCCQCIRIGPLQRLLLLPMAALWQIISLGDAADAIGRAHCSGRSCHQWLHAGPIIAPRKCCQCIRIGPLQRLLLLPMAVLWQIISLGDAADAIGRAHCSSRNCCQWLHVGQLFFLGNAANALGLAHCRGCCCCQWLHFGRLFLWVMLLMQ